MSRRYWNLLMVIVAVAGGAWMQLTREPDNAEIVARVAAHVNFQAPNFELTTLDGESVTLFDYRGKIVLLNFWATWCPPCRTEMPDLQVVTQTHSDLVVLAINNAEDSSVVKAFVRELGLTFPILLDSNGAVARKYNIQGLPTSFFIDRDGIVRAANVGAVNAPYIEAQIKAMK